MTDGIIIQRRICPVPSGKCFRGQCILCNNYEFQPIGDIELYAQAHGYGRDFLLGRTIDFLHANVIRAV